MYICVYLAYNRHDLLIIGTTCNRLAFEHKQIPAEIILFGGSIWRSGGRSGEIQAKLKAKLNLKLKSLARDPWPETPGRSLRPGRSIAPIFAPDMPE